MTKRLILSLVMIALTLAGVTSATLAYFSDGKVLGSNTFTTGTVKLGDFNKNLNVTGLIPGGWVNVDDVEINYTGNIPADLYVGARGTGETPYLADKLWIKIFPHGNTTTPTWQGWVKDLSSGWRPLGTNVTAGLQAYDLWFYLDPTEDNAHQGVTNTDTQVVIYAVQTGQGVPGTMPQNTWTNSGSGWTDVAGWFNI